MFSGEGFPLTREERVRHGGGGAGMGCISRAAVGLKPRPTGGVGDIAAAFIFPAIGVGGQRQTGWLLAMQRELKPKGNSPASGVSRHGRGIKVKPCAA